MSPFWLMIVLLEGVAGFGIMMYLTRPLRAHKAAQASLAERTATVDRLLDFSQTIQGAGKPDQVFETLNHFLRTELGLAGLAILTSDADTAPPIQLRSAWPQDLVNLATLGEMDAALCPCLRQNLPRAFRPEGSPVRCSIDSLLNLPPSHPAYCVPLNIGRKLQVVIHMLLPPGGEWTETRRQLAQTYVNSAHSVLTSLHLLAEAEKQSMTDGLTGLFNRRSMEQLLQRELALCDRHNQSLSLVMIDLDHFKEINDTHGHAAGDHMLKAFADCVRITLRKTDLAFRYGGDEFVIALPQTPLYQAQQVVQKLRQAFMTVDFSDAITHLDKRPTLSIGVAERNKPANILTLTTLLAAADQALYAAKNSTRNCVKVFEPIQAA
ncbi:MAG TPA: GGDEF domain-containing protein [Tepidisphaeraceae bacterium]|nr:GGDEF domain-containing protein [Tepidisphaeraceae bacterium]